MLLFLVLDLFIHPSLEGQPRAAAAALWAPLAFATAALCGRGLAAEADRGTLELLRAAPVPLAWHGLSRTLANALVTLLVAAGTLAGLRLLFALPVSAGLAAAVALAAVGLAVLASLASALAAQARAREILLPILLVPAAAPLLQAGIQATLASLSGADWGGLRLPLLVLAGYDLMALGAAWLLWPIVLEGD